MPAQPDYPDPPYLPVLPLPTLVVNEQGSIAYINPAAEMLLEVALSHCKGRKLEELHLFDAQLPAHCMRVLETGQAIKLLETPVHVPKGVRIACVHLTCVMARREVLVSLEKVEEQGRAASYWKQEITRASGVMAAMLAHEVKNPLSGIRGAAQLLAEEVADEHKALAELIGQEVERINDLLAQVEIFSTGALQMQPVNIHEVLQYVISIASTGFARHVRFVERYDPSLPEVLGRRDHLVQLFLNIVKNAAEAIDGRADACITLTTAYRSFNRDGLGKLPILVSISDNGPGVAEDIRSQLFEPFVTSKEHGRGLGLAIVGKIASDLNAVVELDQETARGATFHVRLAQADI